MSISLARDYSDHTTGMSHLSAKAAASCTEPRSAKCAK